MTWFDVLLQGKAVMEKLTSRGKSPDPDSGSWVVVEAPDEDSAREIAVELYGKPAFIKKLVPTTHEAVLAKRKYYDNLFLEEDEKRAPEKD